MLKYATLLKEILVYAYIWQIPFAWRIIIDPSRGSQPGFNEYMDVSVYIGELFLALALIIHITEHKTEIKAIFRKLEAGLFHVERFWILLLALIFLTANVLFSIDWVLSISSIIHWVFFICFYFLLESIYVSRGTKFFSDIFQILFLSLFIQALIAAAQVVSAESIGLLWLNESKLTLYGINIAKSNILEYVVLRGYGTFSHPNILAAYSLLLLIYIKAMEKEFHVKHSFKIIAIAIVITVVILSQSKLALILLLLLSLYYTLRSSERELFHVKHFHLYISMLIFGIFFIVATYDDLIASAETRIQQANIQLQQVNQLFIGSGIGTYRLSIDHLAINWWNTEPIHFVPAIVVSELGILLVWIIVYWLIKNLKHVSRGTILLRGPILIYLIYIVNTDHYAWDIYQGMFLLVMGVFILIHIDKRRRLSHYNIISDANHTG